MLFIQTRVDEHRCFNEVIVHSVSGTLFPTVPGPATPSFYRLFFAFHQWLGQNKIKTFFFLRNFSIKYFADTDADRKYSYAEEAERRSGVITSLEKRFFPMIQALLLIFISEQHLPMNRWENRLPNAVSYMNWRPVTEDKGQPSESEKQWQSFRL